MIASLQACFPTMMMVFLLTTPSSSSLSSPSSSSSYSNGAAASLNYGKMATKRYERRNANWGGSVIPYVRSQRFPPPPPPPPFTLSYYDLYNPYYSQNSREDDYTSYPGQELSSSYYHSPLAPAIYYAPPRTSKYEVYQAVLPYYYYSSPPSLSTSSSGFVDSFENDMNEDDDVITGKEMFYQPRTSSSSGKSRGRVAAEDVDVVGSYDENINDDLGLMNSMDSVNAAFLQNLIMSQMYKDALLEDQETDVGGRDRGRNRERGGGDVSYGRWENYADESRNGHYKDYFQEDKDVRELKQLVDDMSTSTSNKHQSQHQHFENNQYQNQHQHQKPSDAERMEWFVKKPQRGAHLTISTTTTTKSPSPSLSSSSSSSRQEEAKENFWNWGDDEKKRSLIKPLNSIYGQAFFAFAKNGRKNSVVDFPTSPTFVNYDVDGNIIKDDGEGEDDDLRLSSSTVVSDVSHNNNIKRDSRGVEEKGKDVGQKEEVLARPATPIRQRVLGIVSDNIRKEEKERKRTPSVYDTIKHMLDIEKSMEKQQQQQQQQHQQSSSSSSDFIKPPMRKRIISSEESLTRQLSKLKKEH